MAEGSTEQVVAHVRGLIERGALRPGDRLPAERDLALQIGVSRPTVRAGLRALAAMGVVQSRHGSGTYIPDGPPTLGSEPLSFLAALHGFTREEMYEARRILEVGAAGLAAERATPEQLAALAEEVASLFASMDDPQRFLVHDINFHRTLAAASGNPIVASIVEMVSALYYERRRQTAARASDRDLRDAAEMHRRIYQAVRSRDAGSRARRRCTSTCMQASRHQSQEPPEEPSTRGSGRRDRAAVDAGAARRRADEARKRALMRASLFDLSGRTAVVVGGTSGIGRALALGLADAGADVVATGRRANLVDDVAARDRSARPADAAPDRATSATRRRSRACATRVSRRSARSTSSWPPPASRSGCRRVDDDRRRLAADHRRRT